MTLNQVQEHWRKIGKVYGAHGRFFLDHGWGQITVEIRHVAGRPTGEVRVDFLSADLEKSVQSFPISTECLKSFFQQLVGILKLGAAPRMAASRTEERLAISDEFLSEPVPSSSASAAA